MPGRHVLTIRKIENPYFDFYDDSLIIHGLSPNLQVNKEGFKQFIYLLWKAFPDTRIIFDDIIIERKTEHADVT